MTSNSSSGFSLDNVMTNQTTLLNTIGSLVTFLNRPGSNPARTLFRHGLDLICIPMRRIPLASVAVIDLDCTTGEANHIVHLALVHTSATFSRDGAVPYHGVPAQRRDVSPRNGVAFRDESVKFGTLASPGLSNEMHAHRSHVFGNGSSERAIVGRNG